MAEKEFFSFDEALNELRLKEEELKRLVSEGEIRAFREGDTMRLRRADVENLRTELGGTEIVDLVDASEELVFEDDDDLDETGMATEEISEMDTVLEDDIEDVGEFDEPEVEEVSRSRRKAAPVRRTTSATSVSAESGETEAPWMMVAMMATTLVLILAMPIAVAASKGSVNGLARGIVNSVGALFGADEIPAD